MKPDGDFEIVFQIIAQVMVDEDNQRTKHFSTMSTSISL
jgi:hypothetical protein